MDTQRLTTEELQKILAQFGITVFDVYLYKKLSPDSDLWIIAELTSEDMYTLYSVDEGLVVAPDGTTDVSELNLKHAAPLLTLDGNVSVPYMHDYYLFAGKHGI